MEKAVEHEGDNDTTHRELGTVPKNIEKKLDELNIKERVETIQTTALIKLVRILEES